MDSKMFWTAVAVLAFWEIVGRRMFGRVIKKEQ